MKSGRNEKSIFDINFLIAQYKAPYILKEMELISKNTAGHALSKDTELKNTYTPKSGMVDLIKTGYSLPEADEPEKMLTTSNDTKKEINSNKEDETDTFKMINLVSTNYNLPKVDDDNLLK